jgi:hypothetical protein
MRMCGPMLRNDKEKPMNRVRAMRLKAVFMK